MNQIVNNQYEPNHNDQILDQIALEAKQVFNGAFIAYEGLQVVVND